MIARVLKVESDEIVEAVKKNNVPVEYVIFPDEGHGFVKNEIQGYDQILPFLGQHMKGEPPPAKKAQRSMKQKNDYFRVFFVPGPINSTGIIFANQYI